MFELLLKKGVLFNKLGCATFLTVISGPPPLLYQPISALVNQSSNQLMQTARTSRSAKAFLFRPWAYFQSLNQLAPPLRAVALLILNNIHCSTQLCSEAHSSHHSILAAVESGSDWIETGLCSVYHLLLYYRIDQLTIFSQQTDS